MLKLNYGSDKMKVEVIGEYNNAFIVDDYLLVNAPHGVLEEIVKLNKDMDYIQIIIVTHLDSATYSGLPNFILSEIKRDRKDKLVIIGPKELKKELLKILKKEIDIKSNNLFDELNIDILDAEIIQNNEIFDKTYLTFIRTKYPKMKNSYGFILKEETKSLGYLNSIKYSPGMSYIFKNVNYALVSFDNKELPDNVLNLITQNKNTVIPLNFNSNLNDYLVNHPNFKIIKSGERIFISR